MTGYEIVVGLDDSRAARAALHWAAEQARLAAGVLRAVNVLGWPMVTEPDGTPVLNSRLCEDDAEVANLHRAVLTRIFNEVAPEPHWRLQFGKGQAGKLLVAESAQARLLVVGAGKASERGRISAGSTSHYCLRNCLCPVVAVPADDAESDADS